VSWAPPRRRRPRSYRSRSPPSSQRAVGAPPRWTGIALMAGVVLASLSQTLSEAPSGHWAPRCCEPGPYRVTARPRTRSHLDDRQDPSPTAADLGGQGPTDSPPTRRCPARPERQPPCPRASTRPYVADELLAVPDGEDRFVSQFDGERNRARKQIAVAARPYQGVRAAGAYEQRPDDGLVGPRSDLDLERTSVPAICTSRPAETGTSGAAIR
jgi:hypothetical protein